MIPLVRGKGTASKQILGSLQIDELIGNLDAYGFVCIGEVAFRSGQLGQNTAETEDPGLLLLWRA